MSKITVITSICGGKDNLLEQDKKGEAKWIAYLDKVQKSNTWEVRRAYDRFISPRRNSRVVKMLSHLYTDTEYSLWIDGNLKLLSTPEELVERYLKDHDLAVFKHPTRDCIYDEAMVCAKARLDDPEVIIEQVKHYENQGFAKHKGMGENMFILRRHTDKVKRFNSEWFAQYSRYSARDQLSFPVAVDRAGLRVNYIPEQFRIEEGRYLREDIIELVPHLTPRAEL